MCQIRAGTFPNQIYSTAKQCLKQPHQAAWKYPITAKAGEGRELRDGFGDIRIQIDYTVLKPPLFQSACSTTFSYLAYSGFS